MCTLFDEIAKENERKGRIEGRKEGKAEGKVEGKAEEIVETGFEFGLSQAVILERLQKKLNISLQKAEEYFYKFQKQKI